MDTLTQYEAKKERLVSQFTSLRSSTSNVALRKTTSNLFRAESKRRTGLDVRDLNQVITIDVKNRTVDVEGMTRYETLIEETLRHGLVPAVVPELKTITVGGVYAGIGVETSSFKYGFMHETVLEADILIADGSVLTCSPKKHADLFYGFPNSYGTLGYALRIRLKLFPCKPFVKLMRTTYDSPKQFVQVLSKLGSAGRKSSGVDFIEGTVLAPNKNVITIGTYVDKAPWTTDIYRKPFYKTIGSMQEDYLTVHDYLFRYDPDWFWCSRYLGMENPLIRALVPRRHMRSNNYYKLANWTASLPVMRLVRKHGWRRETLIQDVEAPTAKAPAFIEWFNTEISMAPYIVAPVQQYRDVQYPLSPIAPGKQFMNIGFYAPHKTNKPDLHYTKLIDQKVLAMGVRKMLYSVTTLSAEEFWTVFDKRPYDKLKRKYDPNKRFKTLYEKTALAR